ncbi:hypothetical protein NPIL_500151 [Nephila pilipes]|uniref:Uncharacterized protein n=1 Tax=Nephila pilipes TaxID=299642 RepID=A0A8X6PG89_NEPPI|nr:hypothetical protein NPIL_500151 [Nephila pilipes]
MHSRLNERESNGEARQSLSSIRKSSKFTPKAVSRLWQQFTETSAFARRAGQGRSSIRQNSYNKLYLSYDSQVAHYGDLMHHKAKAKYWNKVSERFSED